MGLIGTIAGPLADWLQDASTVAVVGAAVAAFVVLSIVLNVLQQLLFKDPKEPPVVFHWVPIIGSTVTYGIDPYKFFFSCREKYGDVFTFILLGKKTTVFLGTRGNDFILNGKHSDLNAEEIYRPLTAPVFGADVVYDCPNAKLMEQKKFVKYGLSTAAFQSYVPLIVDETRSLITKHASFKDKQEGTFAVTKFVSELVIYTASRSLQGKEVRERFDSTFADYFHDLDMGFTPINFMLPWLPLPRNRRRDIANKKVTQAYMDIIKERKRTGNEKDSEDMIWNLMQCVYKNGTPIPDEEIAHMMIALLMGGQHSSAATISFILLHLAQEPNMAEELLEEQRRVLGKDLPPLTYENLQKLTLNAQVVRETLRIHSPIHSIMRQVTSPMPVEGTDMVIPRSRVLLAAPGVTAKSSEHFPSPDHWDPHRWDADRQESQAATEDDSEKVDYGYGLVTKGASSPYLPFGAGRHRCIGEQFAYLQIGTIIATMVRNLEFKKADGNGTIMDTDYSSMFSGPMRRTIVRWERREAKKE